MKNVNDMVLDGFVLDAETIEDGFSRAIAEYEFPYLDGVSLEDMGARARTVRVRCYFLNDRFVEHADFLAHIAATRDQLLELDHPDYGPLKGKIRDISSKKDDRLHCAEIEFTFIQDKEPTFEKPALSMGSVSSALEQEFAAAQERQIDSLIEGMRASLGQEAQGLISTEIDESKTLLEQFASASTSARAILSEMDDAISLCESQFSDVEFSGESFVSTIEYGSLLPGRFAEAAAYACERIAIASSASSPANPRNLLSNLKNAYVHFSGLFKNGLFPAADQIACVTAQRFALETSYQYDVDDQAAQNLITLENVQPFDTLGNRKALSETQQLLTVNDLEETLAMARELLQGAIDADRLSQPLKKIAAALLQHVNNARLERYRIIEAVAENTVSLHALLLRHGLPIGFADRVLSLNPQLRNPNFCKGKILLYAR